MCCFRLHFSDLNVLFFKNIKPCCGLLLKKITSCAKKEKKATWARKSPNLPGYQMVRPQVTLCFYIHKQWPMKYKHSN